MTRFIAVLLGAIALACAPAFAKTKEKDAPSWVTEVASREVPTYPAKVPAVVLLYEQKATVDPQGVVHWLTRRAVKILSFEGKGDAEVVEGYEKGGRQVKELRAWLVAPDGFVKPFEKGSVEDIGSYSEDLYNDFRLRRIRVSNPEIGSVFVSESETQEKVTEAQDRFAFQDNLPSLESRYTITAPAGWTVAGRIQNYEAVKPVIDGNSYTWTLKALSFREREQFAPYLFSTVPMLAVDFKPPAGVSDPPSFSAWSDVSQWHSLITDSRADISPEMERRVHELTAGLNSEYDKIAALGRFVQSFRYVEISMDLSHNGGVRPHPASEVFTKQYGDCKDKANLLKAMLKAAGIDSYVVVIFSGDRTRVKKDWPSPSQFNHAILAVKITQPSSANTVIDSPLGRLLLFDPTDELTPIGDLPVYEQGSYALLCAGKQGDLVQMPVIKPEKNVLVQNIEASIDANGSLSATFKSEATGQVARRERALYRSGSPERYKSAMEQYLVYYAKGAAVTKVDVVDSFEKEQFASSLVFDSRRYGQLMQNRLLVINPAIVEPAAVHFPSLKERAEPIILNGKVYRKHVTLNLPPGFTVDELPNPFAAESSFAKFKISYRQEASRLFVDEELQTETVTLPASSYVEVKKFFDTAFGADGQSAVLIKN
jgi:hypothetical protein